MDVPPAPVASVPPPSAEEECPEFVMPLKGGDDEPRKPMTRVLSNSSLKDIMGEASLQRQLSSGTLSQATAHSSTGSLKNVVVEGVNEPDTLDYRIRHVMEGEDGNKAEVSLWHDVPLYCTDAHTGMPTGSVNFVCEIPRCSRKKYEIATNEPGNPIKQDTKKGELRAFKKGDIFFNYGCLPRTWEDPAHVHPDVGVGGDNDPLDVCEIGLRIVETAGVRRVKVLGVLCLIDDGEADWKLICIDEEDRWAPELNDIDDVERLLPGVVDNVREWFRTYKIPDGKPPNVFGLEERCMNRAYAMKVIQECHVAWRDLCAGKSEVGRNLSVGNLAALNMDSDVAAADMIMSDMPVEDGGDASLEF
ncbi:unnamed protein product [Heterosigma akashiwo]|mmetsp:Transcript_21296/g.33633  ORF Transcript_21296/g.33633 Transcript_21296/m.33633 type:complete len:361 (+) Transcript_21296:128-1210(+)